MVLRNRLLCLVLTLSLRSVPVCAQTEVSQLTLLNKRVEEEKQRLSKVEQKRKALAAEIQSQKKLLSELRSKRAQLLTELEKGNAQQLKLDSELKRTEETIAKVETRTRSRLKALYLHRGNELLERIFFVKKNENNNFVRDAFFLSRIRAFAGDWRRESLTKTLSFEDTVF